MSNLDKLFYWRGIAADFINYRGEHVQVPEENRKTLLRAMGIDVDDSAKVKQEVFALDIEPWQHCLAPLVTVLEGETGIDVNFHPDDLESDAELHIRNAEIEPLRWIIAPRALAVTGDYNHGEVHYTRRRIPLPSMPPGYYEISIKNPRRREQSTLAVMPRKTYCYHATQPRKKMWGVIVQLYTLRSSHDWGIGDFGDLKELLKTLARRGADLVGLNPLHALLPDVEHAHSPYSPSDRRFISPMYIDVASVPGSEERLRSFYSDSVKKTLKSLRGVDLVDYKAVKELKYGAMKVLFEQFCEHLASASEAHVNDIWTSFSDYIHSRNASLPGFAIFETEAAPFIDFSESAQQACQRFVVEQFGGYEHLDFGESSPGFCANIVFHCYLQWIAEQQLEECQRVARDGGMVIGIVRDLAVGADKYGYEVSSNSDLFCRDAAVGAPPDPLAQQGQNWGMPPLDPAKLRRTGFAYFIDLLRSNMKHCGGLRIDHAMSLMRLWWCPPGKTADYGAYVFYPFREMLGLLALESHLQQCSVIGEDLGVVPEEFRRAVRDAEIYSNRVFYFEKDHNQKFKHPQYYETQALAMMNNHDVPTLASWWNRSDLALRNSLNLLEEGADYKQVLADRDREKADALELLQQHNLLPETWSRDDVERPADFALIRQLLLLVSRCASEMFVLQLEDLMAMDVPVNVPGTHDEYPNWRRKLSVSVETLFSQPEIEAFMDALNQSRKA